MDIKCEICGISFYRKPSYIKKYKHKCCSKKCMAQSMSIHRKGENCPVWKGNHIACKCLVCGKEFKLMQSVIKQGRGKFCSNKCHFIYKKTRVREKSPAWKGGVTDINKFTRGTDEYKLWRDSVFKKNNYSCAHCGASMTYLEAHHIKPLHRIIKQTYIKYPLLDIKDAVLLNKDIWDIDNGISLCKSCHNKINKRRK